MILPRRGREPLPESDRKQRVVLFLAPATAAAVCADKQGARAALDRWAAMERLAAMQTAKAAKAKKGAK